MDKKMSLWKLPRSATLVVGVGKNLRKGPHLPARRAQTGEVWTFGCSQDKDTFTCALLLQLPLLETGLLGI